MNSCWSTAASTWARFEGSHRALAVGIVFLGDLLHSRQGRVEATLEAFKAWRQRRADIALTLVRGNHDAHAGDPPPAWGIEVVPEPSAIGPLRLCHHPDCVADGYVIAGHLHPAIILRGRANERVRLACYWFGELVGVLPAFGSFTGSAIISPAAGDRVFGIAGESVVGIPVDSPAVGSVGDPRRVTR